MAGALISIMRLAAWQQKYFADGSAIAPL